MSDSKAGLNLPAKLPSQPKQFRLLESQLLDAVASRDLFRLKQQLKKIQQGANNPDDQALAWKKWSTAVAKSNNWVETRAADFPQISFPELPVSERADRNSRSY
jgi:hypothetical protein